MACNGVAISQQYRDRGGLVKLTKSLLDCLKLAEDLAIF